MTVAFTTGGLTVGSGSIVWFGLLTQGPLGALQTDSTLSFAGASANLQGFGPLAQVRDRNSKRAFLSRGVRESAWLVGAPQARRGLGAARRARAWPAFGVLSGRGQVSEDGVARLAAATSPLPAAWRKTEPSRRGSEASPRVG